MIESDKAGLVFEEVIELVAGSPKLRVISSINLMLEKLCVQIENEYEFY